MRSWVLIGTLFFTLSGYAQEAERNWTLNGYVKDLRTLFIVPQGGTVQVDNLLHNRLNFKWYPHDNWTITAEARNRVFYGQIVQSTPNYAEFIQTDDYFDWSVNWVDEPSVVVHSVLDRAHITYSKNNWDIILGRQRVNWGINTVWNPNDLFNAFSYVDFDYEERPGSDALRIQRYYGFANRVELAAKLGDSLDAAVIAGLWAFNKGQYDFQVLGGLAQGDATLGVGWAGNLKTAGFKGEITYFHPNRNFREQQGNLSATLSLDYSFSKGTYVMLSGLYNSTGTTNPQASFLNFAPSAKALSPFKYNVFAMASHPISPILNASLAMIYAPGNHTTFINPGVTLSVATNWDLDVLGQFLLDESGGTFGSSIYLVFTRLKWSF